MNVQIKHNGTTINGFVESYEREHKICTGIGTLRVEVVNTIGRTFDPWDTIDIHENGSFKCRYYISNVENVIPRGVLVLECQDVSKRLVDYFIPDSYTIDYPSYTRYWIDKFLTEAGIDVTFNTSHPGQLLSNNTQLGLQPAYEQVLTLLQMSGWFIYFNQSEEAVIGPLNADLASNVRSVGKTDILNITKTSDDRMLRNRALILGAFDPYTMSYATADVTVHTPWNYDNRDVRAVVISNSNIPNRSSAYRMANQLIKEFAKITIQKELTVWGARNFNLGDAIKVNSTVWKGKGLITTFGTSMSKQGLVTNLIVDERCPRLYGFFDFGDYVYVGTYGDGVWRKHLKFVHTWNNFSSGLTDLRVTDLHINNGVFGSVAASGQMYRTTDEGGWIPVTVTGLMSSSEDTVASGIPVEYIGFSGIMGRAVIVDKESNHIKFGVDTMSGLNMGDYFLDWYPSGVIYSGPLASGSARGWILEYDPYTGQLIGGLGSGIYPIHYSGNYSLSVVDLENDGKNDYVSVMGGTTPLIVGNNNGEFNYGSDPDHLGTAKISLSNLDDTVTTLVVSNLSSTVRTFRYYMEDNVGHHEFSFISKPGGGIVRVTRLLYTTDLANFTLDETDTVDFSLVDTTNDSTVSSTDQTSSEIYRTGVDSYKRFIGGNQQITSSSDNYVLKRHTWEFTSTSTANETLVDYNFSPPVDMNFAAAAFPLTRDNRCIPHYFDTFIVLEWLETETYLGANYNTKHWLQVFVIDLEQSGGVVLVYDSNPTDLPGLTAPFSSLSFFRYGSSFQIIGYERDQSNNHNPLYGLGLQSVTRDSTPMFTGNLLSSNSYQLSEYVAAVRMVPASGSNRHINYGINGTQTVTSATDPFIYDTSVSIPRIEYTRGLDNIVFGLDRGAGITNTALKYNVISPELESTWTTISLAPLHTNFFPVKKADTITGKIYLLARTITGALRTLILNPDTFAVERTITGGTFPAASTAEFIRSRAVGNMVLGIFQNPTSASIENSGFILYQNINPPVGETTGFMVLQREGADYNLIQRESYPIRVDISNNAPLLAVGSGYASFQSNYIYTDMMEQVFATVASGAGQVEDYRYTYLEPMASGVVSSGISIQNTGMYVTGSGIYATDIRTYSGGWQQFYTIPSGIGNRIETSNNGLGGQYVFVTTSGDIPDFFQKDPDQVSFTSYSGLPDSRATIIRLDDRI